jgi:AraC-like DNA-binding protein
VPHPALAPFVDRFWVRVGAGGPRRILPDGCIDLLLDLEAGRAFAVGSMTRARVVEGGAATIAAVRFRPGGAPPFLRMPADQITDRIVEGGALGLRWLTALAGRGEAGVAGVAGALEEALLARLRSVPAPDPLVARVVHGLFSPEPPSIDALAARLGCSRQHLRRVLRQQVGVGGKVLGRVARLQRAVDRLHRDPRSSLAAVAADLGYFDQAHMARDFRELAGVAPGAARADAGSIFPIRSLLEGAYLRA